LIDRSIDRPKIHAPQPSAPNHQALTRHTHTHTHTHTHARRQYMHPWTDGWIQLVIMDETKMQQSTTRKQRIKEAIMHSRTLDVGRGRDEMKPWVLSSFIHWVLQFDSNCNAGTVSMGGSLSSRSACCVDHPPFTCLSVRSSPDRTFLPSRPGYAGKILLSLFYLSGRL